MKPASLFVAACVTLATASIAHATEPLRDDVLVEGKLGFLLPPKCCWIDLPASETLARMRRAANCSAIGGPVGSYSLTDGKLWLRELRSCGGAVPLSEVYPHMRSPELARWMSGEYLVKINPLCRGKDGAGVFEREIALRVDQGTVTSSTDHRYDRAACAK